MNRLFLIGGGRNEASYLRTYWHFVRAATNGERRSIAIVVPVEPGLSEDEIKEREQEARDPFVLFEPIKKDEVHVLFVSPQQPLTAARLTEIDATGVYVADGRTTASHAALCVDRSWVDHLREHDLPYAGSGAGATLASAWAVMGGWLIALQHSNCEISPHKCQDPMDFAEWREGLGFVPFPIEVGATQSGTLSRLTHLVAEGVVPGGWAIDENTMLAIDGDELRVHGPNSCYRVRRLGNGSVRTDIFHAGTVLHRADWQ